MTTPRKPDKFPFSPLAQADGSRPPADPHTPAPLDNHGETHLVPPSNERIPIARDLTRGVDGSDEELIGCYVGPYLVEKKLAKGGMGHVFLAYDETLRRRVALKLMDKTLLDDQDALKRFEREARATAAIQNRNIASIYMVGLAEDGRPFLAMEYLDGGSFLNVIRSRKPLSFSTIALWMEQVAGALQAAGRSNIIHRDIKPANIMLNNEGDAKVVDFGLAKIFFEDSFMTQEGMVLGTPSYMAPEQGQGRSVDRRADIYSLGATFYHIITGRPPFTADSPVQIMMKHVTAPLIPMRSINPEVPIEFDEIIGRSMRKDVDERYQDYESLLSDIQRVRLMCMTRERGSVVGGVSADPGTGATQREGSVLPTPPSVPGTLAPRRTNSHGPALGTLTEEKEGQASGWTPARIAAASIAAILVVAAVAVGMLSRGESGGAAGGEKKNTTAILIRRATEQAIAGNEKTPDSDYRAYLHTVEILRNLRGGIENFKVSEERLPADLSKIATENRVLLNFEVDASGAPLDDWGTPIGWDPGKGLLRSAGLDHRHYTDDDIVVPINGDERIPGLYNNLPKSR